MEFDPNNMIIKLCMQGMHMDENGKREEAEKLFLQAWSQSACDFEWFTTAYCVALHQKNTSDKLEWLELALEHAMKINSQTINPAIATTYSKLAQCYKVLGDSDNNEKSLVLAMSYSDKIYDDGPFYHGTRANLQIGDFLTAKNNSNYEAELVMNHVYFTGRVNVAALAAALANASGEARVYLVEPMGFFEHDPNVTDKKFPGNPTRSYRTESPLKIIGEINDWARVSSDTIQKWRERLANNKGKIIN